MDASRPRQPIRRFDVFAEYRKQEQEAAGVPEPQAKGYGLWVATVVASRRFRGAKAREAAAAAPSDHRAPPGASEWHELDGEPQTDALFDREIVDRMGRSFYEAVFAPAIRAARAEGQPYEAIRDVIRRDWRPV